MSDDFIVKSMDNEHFPGKIHTYKLGSGEPFVKEFPIKSLMLFDLGTFDTVEIDDESYLRSLERMLSYTKQAEKAEIEDKIREIKNEYSKKALHIKRHIKKYEAAIFLKKFEEKYKDYDYESDDFLYTKVKYLEDVIEKLRAEDLIKNFKPKT